REKMSSSRTPFFTKWQLLKDALSAFNKFYLLKYKIIIYFIYDYNHPIMKVKGMVQDGVYVNLFNRSFGNDNRYVGGWWWIYQFSDVTSFRDTDPFCDCR